MRPAARKDIFLTGPKHSGKTSVGKALASLYGCEFIDLDALVEKQTGKSPRSLYREGPDVFRKAETETMRTLFMADLAAGRVIATGGGLIDNPEALELLQNSAAIPIYLEVSAKAAWNRINNPAGGLSPYSGELPPFLQTTNPQETHRILHERRAAAYRSFAKLIINAEDKTPLETAAEILRLTTYPPFAVST